jgi:hypothetical protein
VEQAMRFEMGMPAAWQKNKFLCAAFNLGHARR